MTARIIGLPRRRGIGPNSMVVALWLHGLVLGVLLLPQRPLTLPEPIEVEMMDGEPDAASPQAATLTSAAPAAAVEPSAVSMPDAPALDAPAPDAPLRLAYAAEANTIVRDEQPSVTAVSTNPAPAGPGNPSLGNPSVGNPSVGNPSPHYPPEAERRRLEGVVGVLVRVSRMGMTETVEVTRSSGVPILDYATVDALRQWRFTPAREGTRTVPAAYPFEIRFVLGDRR